MPGARGLRLHPRPGHACVTGTHSHLADGGTVCWQPGPGETVRHAVDAEWEDQALPPALARRMPDAAARDPWGAWTRAEVCAKLLDVPILVWVTTRDWPAEGEALVDGRRLHLSTHRVGGLVVSLGRLEP